MDIDRNDSTSPPSSDMRNKTPTKHLASSSEATRDNSPVSTNEKRLNSTSPEIEATNGRYCSNCDISFTYAHTFIAHKKFYCKGNKTDRTTQSPNSSNVVNVTLATETSVL